MMKKRKLVIGVTTVFFLMGVLSSCNSKKETEDISVITASVDGGYVTNAIDEAAKRYADEKSLKYQLHRVSGGKEKDITVAIEKAAMEGSDVILCNGSAFELPLYEMQKKYSGVNFIILDGVPRKEAGEEYQVRKNTSAVLYAEEQGGFLAGYAAVKEGYTDLGFMGGKTDPGVVHYGVGFVQGANYAAKEMKLSKGKVTVRYTYLGSNALSPTLMEQAGAWYDDGCEVIFAGGGSIGTAVMKAAEQKGKKVIGADCDQAGASGAVLTSVVKEISESVYTAIGDVYDDKFQGKEAKTRDIEDGGIALSMESSRFEKFTMEDYNKIIDQLSTKKVKISTKGIKQLVKDKSGISSVQVDVE